MKTCNCCGKIYLFRPMKAKLYVEDMVAPGFYYNCECNSTLLWPVEKISLKAKIILVLIFFGALCAYFLG